MKRLLFFFLTALLSYFNSYAQPPDVDQPANKVVCVGSNVPSTVFTGAPGARFIWTNSNPAIGLAATGIGNLPAFTATNTGNSPISSTVTVTPVYDYAYISNNNSNDVSVIGTAINPIAATISVGVSSPTGVALSPDGKLLYAANFSSNIISIINTATNSLVRNFSLTAGASGPRDIAVSPDGKKLYIANLVSDNITIVDLENNTSMSHLSVGNEPANIAISPDGTKVYVANGGASTVTVINTADNNSVSTITVQNGPQGIALSPDGTKIYVANYYSNSISVINAANNSVTSHPVIAQANPQAVAVSPDGTKVYVGNYNLNSISVFDATTNALIGSPISVAGKPNNVAVSPDGSKVYVVNAGGVNSISVVNTASSKVMATVPVPSNPYDVAVSADGTKAYVSSSANSVAVINTAAVDLVTTVPLQRGPYGVAASVLNTKVYITNPDTDDVSVINTATNSAEAVIPVGDYPLGIAVSPDGTRVYTANNGHDNVSVINTTTNQVIATINLGEDAPTGIVVSPDGSKVYVTNQVSDNVSVINAATNQVITTIAVGDTPMGIVVSPDGTKLYVANQDAGSVSVINTATNQVVATIPVGTVPDGITVSPDGTRVYVANHGSDNVSVINTATNLVVATIAVGDGPIGISVTPDGTKLYVANNNTGTVSIINTANNALLMSLVVGTNPVGFGNFMAVSTGTSKSFTITINPSTAITTQPAAKTVCVGSPATFTVQATGSNLIYQWRKGGTDIAGANADTYTIANTSAADAGDYDVVVTGDCGAITSAAATLTVNPPLSFLVQPTPQAACAGGNATFSATVGSGGAIAFQWRKNGQDITGATNDSYTITNVAAGDVANYDVVVFGSSCGNITSNAVALTLTPVTAITSQPSDQAVCAGSAATFSVSATGANLTYQWRKGGNAITGANSNTYTIGNVTAADAGSFDVVVAGDCGSVTSSSVALTVPATSVITTQPSAQAVCAGSAASFTVAATGTNLTYQWRKGSTAITGATSNTYTISNPAVTDAGSYDVVVTGDCGTITSIPVELTVNAAPVAPLITTSGPTTFCGGGSITLTSSAALGNQWFKDGVAIGGATDQTFTASTSGAYTVQTTQNSCASSVSVATNVVVAPVPAIPVITATGNLLTSSATTGNQWFLNGVAINGATGQTHRVQAAGLYTVEVTAGSCASVSVPYNFVATANIHLELKNGIVTIYPNPVVKQLLVKNRSGHQLRVQLFDSFGKQVHNSKVVSTQGTIDVQGFSAGIYQVRITDLTTNKTITQSIIKL